MKENGQEVFFPVIPSDGLTLSLTVSFPSWLGTVVAGLFTRGRYHGRHER